MKLFAIFALLICAVLALTGASPVADQGDLQPGAAGEGYVQPALREARSPAQKKPKTYPTAGGYGEGGGYGGYGGGYGK